jgi:hypothetical protein
MYVREKILMCLYARLATVRHRQLQQSVRWSSLTCLSIADAGARLALEKHATRLGAAVWVPASRSAHHGRLRKCAFSAGDNHQSHDLARSGREYKPLMQNCVGDTVLVVPALESSREQSLLHLSAVMNRQTACRVAWHRSTPPPHK